MMTKKQRLDSWAGKKFIFMLLSAYLGFGTLNAAYANDADNTEEWLDAHPVKLQEEKAEPTKSVEISEPEKMEVAAVVTEADLQKAREKVGNALREKGEHSIEMTEARLELARLELKTLVDRDDLQRLGALISLKKDKVRVLENLLQRKIAAERSRAEAEKSRIAAEILKRELAEEIKELAQEQKELAQVKKEEVQALEEEAQARTELQEVIKQLNQKIKELNRKMH